MNWRHFCCPPPTNAEEALSSQQYTLLPKFGDYLVFFVLLGCILGEYFMHHTEYKMGNPVAAFGGVLGILLTLIVYPIMRARAKKMIICDVIEIDDKRQKKSL